MAVKAARGGGGREHDGKGECEQVEWVEWRGVCVCPSFPFPECRVVKVTAKGCRGKESSAEHQRHIPHRLEGKKDGLGCDFASSCLVALQAISEVGRESALTTQLKSKWTRQSSALPHARGATTRGCNNMQHMWHICE